MSRLSEPSKVPAPRQMSPPQSVARAASSTVAHVPGTLGVQYTEPSQSSSTLSPRVSVAPGCARAFASSQSTSEV